MRTDAILHLGGCRTNRRRDSAGYEGPTLENRCVAYNFVSGDRDQLMLMPPSVADWLPGDHLAWFVLDVVAELDLSAFRPRYRQDGRGGAAYDPSGAGGGVGVRLLCGRAVQPQDREASHRDVAYRVLAANQQPDHATIARFRALQQDAIAGLFGQVVAICARSGLLRPGLVAIDGTKLVANASRDASRTAQQLAEEILAEAAAADAAEDATVETDPAVRVDPGGRPARRARLRGPAGRVGG